METNFNKKDENINETGQSEGFWHSGWAYLIFFIGIIGALIAIAYGVKSLLL
jgi:hypothetical protein